MDTDSTNSSAKFSRDKALSLEKSRREKDSIDAFKKIETKMSPKILAEQNIKRAINEFTEGREKNNQAKIDNALNLLREAVRLDSASENGWLSLGNIYYNQSKTNPDKAETREEDKNISKSIESFTSCLTVNPKNFECRYGLAAALIDSGKCGSAVEQLLICKDMKPNLKKIYLSLGQAYDCMASGNMKTADEYRNEAATKTE
ncbi:MAG: hypothetical protein NTY20_03570 [Candidatus Aenigmarchaeota archaeon]|nr:hypothetical protein [Candidatus Aenigmarchaeota archaeon]